MATRAEETAPTHLPSGPSGAVDASWEASFENVITTYLPPELQATGRDLVHAVATRVAVAEHFDAFCALAFSKPDWASAASPVLAEIFEHDEDQLAELARIPDLIIEMGTGQVTVTCMVASRWAARGETHRLSRLADAVGASHACKNASSVDVMLALAATLAITRHSRADQLYNAALSLAGEEHQEALADARLWLAAGRVVCSFSPEERDFWDTRLRKPRQAWSWSSKEELHALDTLAASMVINPETEKLFKPIVPASWWNLVKRCSDLENQVLEAQKQAEEARVQSAIVPGVGEALRPSFEESARQADPAVREFLTRPRPGKFARFVLGWVCGALAMAITIVVLLLLPNESIQRVFGIIKAAPPPETPVEVARLDSDPKEKESWRQDNLKRLSAEMADYAKFHAAAKAGSWSANERILSGRGTELPLGSPNHLKLLVWLHLDPPADSETRTNVARLLLAQVKAGAISLWEELIYPGSPNAQEIKDVARAALSDSTIQWKPDEKHRLEAIAATETK